MAKKEFHIPFHIRLFLVVVSLFVLAGSSFIVYQYQREKSFRVELFNTKLQGINSRIYSLLPSMDNESKLEYYIHRYLADYPNYKLTIIERDKYTVVFDSFHGDDVMQDWYLRAKEIKEAVSNKSGYEIRKEIKTSAYYFFSATSYPEYIIRSAVPYDSLLESTLKGDTKYLIFSFILAVVLIALFYSYATKLGYAINKLRRFAEKAEDDKFIQWESSAPSFRGELGEVTQHIITAYKKLHATKEALSIEKDKFFSHLQFSREGLGFFSAQRKAILANKLFLHYSAQISDAIVKDSEDLLSVPELKPILTHIDDVQYTPSADYNKRKSILVSKNNKDFVIECIIFDDLSFELSINDITYEEEKKQLKKQLTQNIAHELKTPVSSIQGYLETMVLRPNLADEKRIEFLNKCYAQSNRLAQLLRDLSILNRIEDLDEVYDKEPIDIQILITSIIDDIDLDLKNKNIRVHDEINSSIEVFGNYSLVYSVFRNLLDNSINYAGEDIDIYISCFKETEEAVYFSYRDTGVGIAEKHLNKIFDRFYRVDEGRARKNGGTGLGLAIVKNAVRIHGGNIVVKSDEGKGVEFIFMISKNFFKDNL